MHTQSFRAGSIYNAETKVLVCHSCLVLTYFLNTCMLWFCPGYSVYTTVLFLIKIYDTSSLLTNEIDKPPDKGEMMCIGVFWGCACISVWQQPENLSLENQQLPFVFSQFMLDFFLDVEDNTRETSVAD